MATGERVTSGFFGILLILLTLMLIGATVPLAQFLSDPHQGMMVILAMAVTVALALFCLKIAIFDCLRMAFTGRWT